MREVFANAIHAITQLRDRTISTVVSHSQQAREIEKLRQDFHDLQARMNSVVDEAQRYRTDLHAVISERDKYKRDADDAMAMAESYAHERDETKQRLNEAQAVSTRLGEDLAQEQRNHEATKANLERACQDRDRLVGDRDYYRERYYQSKNEAEQAEKNLKEANDRLAKLQESFRSIFPEAPKSLTEQAKPVEELPGKAPSFHPYSRDDLPSVSNPVQEPPREEPGQVADEGRQGNVEPHPVQSAGERNPNYGVNERIDGQDPKPDAVKQENEDHQEEVPWWKKPAAQ